MLQKIYWQHFRSTNDLPQCLSKLYIYVGSGLGCLTPLSTIFQLSCGQSVLLVEKTGVPGENCRPVTSHWLTLSHNFVSSTPRLRGISLYRKYPPPLSGGICTIVKSLPHRQIINEKDLPYSIKCYIYIDNRYVYTFIVINTFEAFFIFKSY